MHDNCTLFHIVRGLTPMAEFDNVALVRSQRVGPDLISGAISLAIRSTRSSRSHVMREGTSLKMFLQDMCQNQDYQVALVTMTI
jgi:hypothetical protein